MSETHLNALLDRYLHKYVPAAHTQYVAAQQPLQQQQQQQQQPQFQQPSAAPSAPTAVPVAPSSSAFDSSMSSSSSARPAAMFHQNDLSIIQGQIDSLSRQLQRAPHAVTATGAAQSAAAVATLQSGAQSINGAASLQHSLAQQYPSLAASTAQQQQQQQQQQHQKPRAAPASSGSSSSSLSSSGAQQLHMHELDQSIAIHGKQYPHLQSQQSQQGQTSSASAQQQPAGGASTASFSPSRRKDSGASAANSAAPSPRESPRRHAPSTRPAQPSSPSSSSSSSTSALRAQLAAAQQQIAKQALQISERDFALATANRELNSLRARAEATRPTLQAHQSLLAERAAQQKSLERSEKIRKEQLEYIRMLHQQLSFLQSAAPAVLQASPDKPQQQKGHCAETHLRSNLHGHGSSGHEEKYAHVPHRDEFAKDSAHQTLGVSFAPFESSDHSSMPSQLHRDFPHLMQQHHQQSSDRREATSPFQLDGDGADESRLDGSDAAADGNESFSSDRALRMVRQHMQQHQHQHQQRSQRVDDHDHEADDNDAAERSASVRPFSTASTLRSSRSSASGSAGFASTHRPATGAATTSRMPFGGGGGQGALPHRPVSSSLHSRSRASSIKKPSGSTGTGTAAFAPSSSSSTNRASSVKKIITHAHAHSHAHTLALGTAAHTSRPAAAASALASSSQRGSRLSLSARPQSAAASRSRASSAKPPMR